MDRLYQFKTKKPWQKYCKYVVKYHKAIQLYAPYLLVWSRRRTKNKVQGTIRKISVWRVIKMVGSIIGYVIFAWRSVQESTGVGHYFTNIIKVTNSDLFIAWIQVVNATFNRLSLIWFILQVHSGKTGNNFWSRPIELEKSYSRFNPQIHLSLKT